MGKSLLVHEPGSMLVQAVVYDRNMEPTCENGTDQVHKFMSPKNLVSESAECFASILVPYRKFCHHLQLFGSGQCVPLANVFWIVGLGRSGLSPNLGVEDVFLISGLSILGPVWWCIRGSVPGGPV